MQIITITFRKLLISAGLCMLLPLVCRAEAFPERPITIIVPQVPGAGSDVVTRVIAHKMSAALKQTVVVENRPGAGGNIGTVLVAKAKPDGYTLLMASVGHAINPALYKNAGFDALKDFAPVASFADGTLLLIAGPSFQGDTVKSVIDEANAHPGELFYASGGNGTINHLGAVMFERAAGIKLSHVPYKSTPASANDVASGVIPLSFQALASAHGYIQSGKVRVLAVTNKSRLKALPDVPAIAETLPNFDIEPWYGLFAPAGTPDAILTLLNTATNAALSDPEVQASLQAQGIEAAPKSRSQFASQIEREVSLWSEVVKESGARVD